MTEVAALEKDVAALEVTVVDEGKDTATDGEESPTTTAIDPIAIARARAAAAMKGKKKGGKSKKGGNAAVEAARAAKGGGKKNGKKKMSSKEWNEKNYAAGHFAA
ncbi:hypothetical protein TrCOL_g13236 [Triparma columacea]|uniref:Uncharacterized protein n=1 Tax=Triparma columacea TaxID=722753 RepID=A0A9W7G5I7_9STRA|nr:hypothetical protein TrCOL_g13236 [Triparma columacea]